MGTRRKNATIVEFGPRGRLTSALFCRVAATHDDPSFDLHSIIRPPNSAPPLILENDVQGVNYSRNVAEDRE